MEKKTWGVLGLLMLLSLILQIDADELWLWDRTRLEVGEWWRWATGHWVHLGLVHLALNLTGVILLGVLFQGVLSWQSWLLAFLLLPLWISAGIWYLLPGLQIYAGLSGVLHGIFVLGAIRMMGLPADRLTGCALLMLAIAKMYFENIAGDAMLTRELIGAHVLVEAHQYGSVGGGLMAMGWLALSKVHRRRPVRPATKLVP